MKLTIRPVKAADIGNLHKLLTDFVAEYEPEYPKHDAEEIDRQIFHILSNLSNPTYVYLIAYDGKKPVGYFIGYIGTHEYGKPSVVGVAQELYVVPKKRAMMIGPALMREALKIALKGGAQAIECVGTYGTTDKQWEQFGFKLHLSYGHMDLDTARRRILRE